MFFFIGESVKSKINICTRFLFIIFAILFHICSDHFHYQEKKWQKFLFITFVTFNWKFIVKSSSSLKFLPKSINNQRDLSFRFKQGFHNSIYSPRAKKDKIRIIVYWARCISFVGKKYVFLKKKVSFLYESLKFIRLTYIGNFVHFFLNLCVWCLKIKEFLK